MSFDRVYLSQLTEGAVPFEDELSRENFATLAPYSDMQDQLTDTGDVDPLQVPSFEDMPELSFDDPSQSSEGGLYMAHGDIQVYESEMKNLFKMELTNDDFDVPVKGVDCSRERFTEEVQEDVTEYGKSTISDVIVAFTPLGLEDGVLKVRFVYVLQKSTRVNEQGVFSRLVSSLLPSIGS